MDVWDDRQRAGNPEPLHRWDTVTKVKANEHAIAAISADGRVIFFVASAFRPVWPGRCI